MLLLRESCSLFSGGAGVRAAFLPRFRALLSASLPSTQLALQSRGKRARMHFFPSSPPHPHANQPTPTKRIAPAAARPCAAPTPLRRPFFFDDCVTKTPRPEQRQGSLYINEDLTGRSRPMAAARAASASAALVVLALATALATAPSAKRGLGLGRRFLGRVLVRR